MKKIIKIKDNRFVDNNDNHLILHGINMVCKDKEKNYIGSWDFNDFNTLKQWGFNVIRLGIIWDGIEPEPGAYDTDYLNKIDQLINFAKENDIYVYLDMHQDLFSCRFSDGAPKWATLTDGLAHDNSGDVWSDAYFTSPAVQRSFDNFWDNKLAVDGKGIQTHYIELWQMLAKRYKSEPYVIGYDLMNEPFVGSTANTVMETLFYHFGKNFVDPSNLSNTSVSDISLMWLDAEARSTLLEQVADSKNYASLIDVTEALLKAFDKNKLMPFYKKLTQTIREVDKESLIFLETNYFGNLGVFTGIEPILDKKGKRVSNQVYAPHGYDLVTDTEFMKNANLSRIDLIFNRHNQTSLRLNMPLMIGEWGAYQGLSGLKKQAIHTAKLFEQFLCSDTYWCYDEKIDFEKQSFFDSIHRSYPMKIVGTIKEYKSTKQGFQCNWQERDSLNQDNCFYIKDINSINTQSIKLVPESDFDIIKNKTNNSGYIKIKSLGKNSLRHLDINIKNG